MTKKPLEIYNQFDVIVVPFPFTDSTTVRRRPALIISSSQSDHYVMAMITTAENSKWHLDHTIKELKPTGLKLPCIVRMKLFTLDAQFILKKIGSLALKDKKNVIKNISTLFKL